PRGVVHDHVVQGQLLQDGSKLGLGIGLQHPRGPTRCWCTSSHWLCSLASDGRDFDVIVDHNRGLQCPTFKEDRSKTNACSTRYLKRKTSTIIFSTSERFHMKHSTSLIALTLAAGLTLSACSDASDSAEPAPATSESADSSDNAATSENATEDEGHKDMAHDHPEDGGAPPAGIEEAENPTYPVGTEVTLTADHMPGMDGATATISGAFDTTTYSVSYTPTNGDAPVTDHRWVVHEELVDPGEAPLADGAKAVMTAEHMPGMKDAEATIDYSTQETVYMVDIDNDEMTMKNHKWVTESEIEPAQYPITLRQLVTSCLDKAVPLSAG